MKGRTWDKRLLSMLLVCLMCVSLAPEALAAAATAATVRLMKTEGTVAITGSNGRSVSVRDDLLLYSGYSVSTEEASYAWVNLDDAKLLKEDAVSEIGVRKNGKKLDILLESGNLFFHVKETLDADETFHIRTSTMAVGIRGTCGWVQAIDQWTSQIYILEGSVEVAVTDPVTGETKTETVTGGETARCAVYPQDHTGGKCGIVRQKFTADDISGFVLVDVVPDQQLCEEIYEDSGIDLRNWPDDPEDRLKRNETETHDKLQESGEKREEQDRNSVAVLAWDKPDPTCTIPAARSAVSYAAPVYTDVPADAWYAEAVRYCHDNGLMNGTSDTAFTPDGALTRAVMVTVLHRLAGTPAAETAAAFHDVGAGKWYTEAVSWANGKGIVLGYNESTFGPNDPVTHEQMALIFQRYTGDPNMETIGADTPKAPATRAEAAVTLMNCAKGQTDLASGALSALSAMDIMCSPSGIALDTDGSLLVTDVYNKQVWSVTGRTSKAYAGSATAPDLYGQPVGGYHDAELSGSRFKEPWAIVPFRDGWAVSDTANKAVRFIQDGSVKTINGASNEGLTATKLGVSFNYPTGLASDPTGYLYIADTYAGVVRRVTPNGGVLTVARNLSEPTGLFWKAGALYIAETGRNCIAKLENGKVIRLAGNGEAGLRDGSAEQASFSAPQGVVVGDDGTIYVADTGNSAIRQIKDGTVTTLAVRGTEQLSGGLTSPRGMVIQDGKLYICDTFARKVFVLQL